MYDDDSVLLRSAETVVGEGVKVRDVFSPFPIHGLDPVIGVKHTRLGIAAFMYGCLGCTLAVCGMYYFMIYDWPMNIGGKPSMSLFYNIPSFIPITFEFTVFCAAHGMAITYMLANRTLPGMDAHNPDPRTTDDKFVMELRTSDNPHHTAEQLTTLLQNAGGVIELDQKEI